MRARSEYGRDPAIRYKDTSVLIFPQTMISKRIEDGVEFEVMALYEGLLAQLEDVLAQGPD